MSPARIYLTGPTLRLIVQVELLSAAQWQVRQAPQKNPYLILGCSHASVEVPIVPGLERFTHERLDKEEFFPGHGDHDL